MQAKSCVRKVEFRECQHIVLGAAHYRDGGPARELEIHWASLCRFQNTCSEKIDSFPSPRLEYT